MKVFFGVPKTVPSPQNGPWRVKKILRITPKRSPVPKWVPGGILAEAISYLKTCLKHVKNLVKNVV